MTKRSTNVDERGVQLGRIAPGSQMTLVTKNDDIDNMPPNATLYVTGAGNLVVIPEDNEDADAVTIPVLAGQFISDCTFRRVKSTGTTATGIWAVH